MYWRCIFPNLSSELDPFFGMFCPAPLKVLVAEL